MSIFKKIKNVVTIAFTKVKVLLGIEKKLVIQKPIDAGTIIKPISDTADIITTHIETDVNLPFDKDNVKNGEIGGYIIYNKNTATVDNEFIKNLKELGINILYFNTPRDKKNPSTFLSYNEWVEIFDKFKDSGIKLMLYIYETLVKKDSYGNIIYNKWTDSEIRSISNHPSFYAWIAEDEVSSATFNTSLAWIKTFYAQKFSDKTRKWPVISICFFPKTDRLINLGYIGDHYDDYLEMWAPYTDIALANMYPIISSQKNNVHYNTESGGEDCYSKQTGGENWYQYLKAHLEFTNRHPEIIHRLYMHTCKDVTNDSSGKPFISKPKPTLINTKIQAYANLMTGSNGLMFFVLGDIGERFSNAAFGQDLKPNMDTYNIFKTFYTSNKFKNFKKIMVNLHPDSILYYNKDNVFNEKSNEFIDCFEDGAEVFVTYAHNQTYNYCVILNISLVYATSVRTKKGNHMLDLTNGTKTRTEDDKIQIEPGEIIMMKREKDLLLKTKKS